MNLSFQGKKAIVRVDFNVPLEKTTFAITDDTRIRAALPTINAILEQGGAVILMSHLDRPLKKLREDGSIDVQRFTLRHVLAHLSELLGRPVLFAADCLGVVTEAMAANLKAGEVLLLENTRFHKGEEKGDPDMAKALAALGDIYVNDAFGTAHRAHASTTTMAQFFDREHKTFGFLMQAELDNAKRVMDSPERPFTAIVGGAKVSDKLLLLDKMLDVVDNLIVGGGMAYTFFKAQGGNIGGSLCELDKLDLALQLIEKAKSKGINLLLPIDSVCADRFAADAKTQVADSNNIPDGWMGLDIGEKAVTTFNETIAASHTILWNGPMGVFEMEAFANGTREVAQAIADATQAGAFSLVGGGDSVAAVTQMGLEHSVSFVSTGGGAMLELLEGKTLPGVAAINA
jgi:phosphoglycerate kinase